MRVHAKVIEGDRERIQAFEGVVIRIRKGGANSNFTVRRISHGIGVERIFPYHSPLIDKVDVMRVGRVRRAKLYYLRSRVGKAARIKAGSRSRFEELTASMGAVPEDEIEEEVLAAEEEVLSEDGADAEGGVAESVEAVEAEASEETGAEAAEEAEAEAEPEASEQPVAEAAEGAEEPEAEAAAEEQPESEPAAAEEPAEEPAAEDAAPSEGPEEAPAEEPEAGSDDDAEK